ncbi:hypothetical protein [Profundibacter sp.]|uniref:hypothetical protein n=1 Tax=Profundibacter sp. TaxID=3101071 RepID=UPI003D12751A
MSVATWPDSLPRPMRNGFQSQLQDGRKSKSGETGPPAYRRRFSSVVREYSMTIDVPRSEKAVFDNFYRTATKLGTKPFWMPDPTTDGWSMLDASGNPLLTSSGAPLLLSARWLCLFGASTPRETVKGIRFRIAFQIAVLP